MINEAAGTIEADGQLSLAQTFPSQPLINRGTLRAGVDSLLFINGGGFTPGPAEVDNTNGLIEVLEGGRVDLSQSLVSGGTLQTVGDGVFTVEQDFSEQDVARIRDAVVSGNIQFGDIDGFSGSNGQIELERINTNGQDLNFTLAGDQFFGSTGFGTISFVGDSRLDGGGTIRLAANGIGIFDSDSGVEGSLTNADHTIEGFGGINYQTQDFVNDTNGLINANVDERSLFLSTGSVDNSVINRGVLQASNGGELVIEGNDNDNNFGVPQNGFLDNTGGRIQALSGSVVRLNNQAVVVGGEIVGDDDSRLIVGLDRFGGFSSVRGGLRDVTLDVEVEFTEGVRNGFGLEGQIVNRKSISLSPSSTLVIDGDTTLSGGGTIQVEGIDRFDVVIATDRGQESHADKSSNTIQGTGRIGTDNSGLDIVNEATGVIDANVANGTLALGTEFGSSLTNRGVLRASNGGELEIILGNGTFDFDSGVFVEDVFVNDGIIEAQEASLVFSPGQLRNGVDGTLQGDGTIAFAASRTGIINEGTIAPGLSSGTLTLDTSVELAASSILEIDLFGTEDGQFDVLNVAGDLDLDGLLSVDLGDFNPTFTDEFIVATAGRFFGSFDDVVFGGSHLSNDGQFEFLVTLDETSATPGLRLSNFQATAVPEPGSAVLVGLVLSIGIARRRRS